MVEKEEKNKPEINIEEIGEKIKNNKKISKKELSTLKRKIFFILFTLGIVMFIFIFILIGYGNIPLKNYITDLKVFSIIALLVTIAIFEYAYKKDSGKFAIMGIESLLASITILSLHYILQYNVFPYTKYLIFMAVLFIVYYLIKLFVVCIKDIHKYKKNANDIKRIIKKEEI